MSSESSRNEETIFIIILHNLTTQHLLTSNLRRKLVLVNQDPLVNSRNFEPFAHAGSPPTHTATVSTHRQSDKSDEIHGDWRQEVNGH